MNAASYGKTPSPAAPPSAPKRRESSVTGVSASVASKLAAASKRASAPAAQVPKKTEAPFSRTNTHSELQEMKAVVKVMKATERDQLAAGANMNDDLTTLKAQVGVR